MRIVSSFVVACILSSIEADVQFQEDSILLFEDNDYNNDSSFSSECPPGYSFGRTNECVEILDSESSGN